jgi:hypothetical protein
MINIYLFTDGIVDLILSLSVISTNNTRFKSRETKQKITKTVHINKRPVLHRCH